MKQYLVQQATSGVTSLDPALKPQSISGSSAVHGAIIDRQGFLEAILTLAWAAASGSPSPATLAVIFEHGEASNLSDVATLFTLETASDLTADTVLDFHINLLSAKRYVRVTVTPTYTGGSSPANVMAANILLGHAENEPVPSAVTVWGT